MSEQQRDGMAIYVGTDEPYTLVGYTKQIAADVRQQVNGWSAVDAISLTPWLSLRNRGVRAVLVSTQAQADMIFARCGRYAPASQARPLTCAITAGCPLRAGDRSVSACATTAATNRSPLPTYVGTNPPHGATG